MTEQPPAWDGLPEAPERAREHWLVSVSGLVFAARWTGGVRSWFFAGDDREYEPSDVALYNTYLGPCLTPPEVAAKVEAEREACAKACEERAANWGGWAEEHADEADWCAAAIRARGEGGAHD